MNARADARARRARTAGPRSALAAAASYAATRPACVRGSGNRPSQFPQIREMCRQRLGDARFDLLLGLTDGDNAVDIGTVRTPASFLGLLVDDEVGGHRSSGSLVARRITPRCRGNGIESLPATMTTRIGPLCPNGQRYAICRCRAHKPRTTWSGPRPAGHAITACTAPSAPAGWNRGAAPASALDLPQPLRSTTPPGHCDPRARGRLGWTPDCAGSGNGPPAR